nr:hypothetical protein CFP56_05766 [Quercus suber]
MGRLNPMDLELDSKEAKIKERLYKAFEGHVASPTGQRARFSSWILAFKKLGSRAIGKATFLAMWLSCLYSELDQLHYNELAGSLYHIVDSGVNIVMLQAFAWECSRSYLNVGKSVSDIRDTKRVISIGILDGEDRFFGFEHGFPLLMKWMALKNKIVEAPEPEIEERKSPRKRVRNETPLAGSVSRRKRSKIEHVVGSSKKDKSKSPVIVLYDSPVRDTSLAFTTPAVEAFGPPLVSTIEIVPFLGPDFKARTYWRKTTAHRVKVVKPDVESFSGKVNS